MATTSNGRPCAYSGTKEATMEKQGNKAKPLWKMSKERLKSRSHCSLAGRPASYPDVRTKPDEHALWTACPASTSGHQPNDRTPSRTSSPWSNGFNDPASHRQATPPGRPANSPDVRPEPGRQVPACVQPGPSDHVSLSSTPTTWTINSRPLPPH